MFNASGWSLWIAIGSAALVCGLMARAFWNDWVIRRLQPIAGAREADCMAVIPARNEESIIARAVKSLPHDSVIVIDDHSDDHTAEAARKAGAGVLPAPDLQRGAVGKSNACMFGARAIQSRWILFADADTWFESGFLTAVAAMAESSELSIVSVHLDARPGSLLDRALLPVANIIYYASVRPKGDPVTAFRGECILARRNGYEFLGGHGAVLNSLTEDTKLAALALRHRLTLGVVRSGPLGHVEFRHAISTIRRMGYRLVLLDSATVFVTLTGSLVMLLWSAAALAAGLAGNWTAAAVLIGVPVLATMVLYRNLAALLLPLSAWLFALSLWSGFYRALRGRKIQWKGRPV